jgi:hypothetical protein
MAIPSKLASLPLFQSDVGAVGDVLLARSRADALLGTYGVQASQQTMRLILTAAFLQLVERSGPIPSYADLVGLLDGVRATVKLLSEPCDFATQFQDYVLAELQSLSAEALSTVVGHCISAVKLEWEQKGKTLRDVVIS